jgi:hypothetical protein
MRYVVLIVILVARTASAQPPGETEPVIPDEKSALTAYFVSALATSGPAAVGLLVFGDRDDPRGAIGGMIATAGMVVGPTAGHWYAGRTWTTGLTLRLASMGIVAGMVIRDQQEPLELGTVIVGLTAAGGLWGTGAVWDLVTLPRSVRRYNREHALVIAPTTNGVAIAGRF